MRVYIVLQNHQKVGTFLEIKFKSWTESKMYSAVWTKVFCTKRHYEFAISRRQPPSGCTHMTFYVSYTIFAKSVWLFSLMSKKKSVTFFVKNSPFFIIDKDLSCFCGKTLGKTLLSSGVIKTLVPKYFLSNYHSLISSLINA